MPGKDFRMGPKIPFPLLVALPLLCAAPQPHAAEPGRPPRYSSRETIREYRIALKQARNAVRDSARRENNILIGIAPSVDLIRQDPGGEPRIEENASCLGFTVGYRTHFLPVLGLKAGTQYFRGSTHAAWTNGPPIGDNYYAYETTSEGSQGTTYGFNTTIQAIFGPFGRLTLEPGAGMTWGAHTADSVLLTGEAGNRMQPLVSHFAFYDGILAASLYFGSRDQYDISPSILFGFSPALRSMVKYQFNLALVYAFRIPKDKD